MIRDGVSVIVAIILVSDRRSVTLPEISCAELDKLRCVRAAARRVATAGPVDTVSVPAGENL